MSTAAGLNFHRSSLSLYFPRGCASNSSLLRAYEMRSHNQKFELVDSEAGGDRSDFCFDDKFRFGIALVAPTILLLSAAVFSFFPYMFAACAEIPDLTRAGIFLSAVADCLLAFLAPCGTLCIELARVPHASTPRPTFIVLDAIVVLLFVAGNAMILASWTSVEASCGAVFLPVTVLLFVVNMSFLGWWLYRLILSTRQGLLELKQHSPERSPEHSQQQQQQVI